VWGLSRARAALDSVLKQAIAQRGLTDARSRPLRERMLHARLFMDHAHLILANRPDSVDALVSFRMAPAQRVCLNDAFSNGVIRSIPERNEAVG
jgi:hypothetical protein